MLRRLAGGGLPLRRAGRRFSAMASAAASSAGDTTTTTGSNTPMEDVIRSKITASMQPTRLDIFNDSHLHAHHKAMAGSSSRETHFRLVITSAAFQAKAQPARHRMVYALLRDEMAAEGGIHALQLRTLTPEEAERRRLQEEGEGEGEGKA